MIELRAVSIPLSFEMETLRQIAAKKLKCPVSEILEVQVLKRSVDARKKQAICFVMTLGVKLKDTRKETAVVKKLNTANIKIFQMKPVAICNHSNDHHLNRQSFVGPGLLGCLQHYIWHVPVPSQLCWNVAATCSDVRL